MNVPAVLTAAAVCGFLVWLAWTSWDSSARAAERRWRRINRQARQAGCRCGRPATQVQEFGDTVGRVPYQVWTCDDHVGVVSWSGVGPDAVPAWPRSGRCATCINRCGESTRIGDTEPYQFHCPNREAVR